MSAALQQSWPPFVLIAGLLLIALLAAALLLDAVVTAVALGTLARH